MSNKDIVSSNYLSDNERFADALNFLMFDGRKVIDSNKLINEDTTERVLIRNRKSLFTSKRIRDIAKRMVIKSDKGISYIILGIENQSEIHYAMPVRNMLYDAMSYSSQVTEKKNKHNKLLRGSSSEFLSGLSREDKLKPVITVVVNWSGSAWDGPTKLSEMMDNYPDFQKYINDYKIFLLDPHKITDFGLFNTPLGEVLEFIKRQNDKGFLLNMRKEKGTDWKMDIDSVNAINTFTGAKIPVDDAKEGMVDMCKATQALIDEGLEKGMEEGTTLINQLNSKLIEEGRMDDLKRATKDPKYQKKLIEQYFNNTK